MKRTNLLNNESSIAPSPGLIFEANDAASAKGESKKRLLIISAIAFFIAVLVSFISKFLALLIDLFTNISFYGNFSFLHTTPAANSLGLFVIIVPALGGVVIGLMELYGSKSIRGHGIPEAMEQILTNQSKIKPSITFLKPLSSAIAIGTGGPFGAEGPIIATGGALGSTLGQVLKVSHNERKVILAAGAAAGMASIFGTPIAALFLAIELLLFEFSPRSFIPVTIACVVGAAGHYLLFDPKPAFAMYEIEPPAISALAVYSSIGIVIGVLAVGVSKSVYFFEEAFDKLPVHWMWRPAIGGLFVGLVGYFAPRTLGVGYENIAHILSGSLPLQVLLSLCFLKFISWAVALGSGTSGGTLAPLLTIGGATGALLGTGIIYFFPQSGIAIPVAALIGMTALFAGASRALLTSIIFAVEATGQAEALLPLLGGCLCSYFVSFLLMKNTIMTEKIARKGVKTPHSYESDILERLTVEQVMNDDVVVVSEDDRIGEVRKWLNEQQGAQFDYFMVATNEGEYKGIMSFSDLYSNRYPEENKIETLLKSSAMFVNLNDTLRSVVDLMAKESAAALPVITTKNKTVVGIISYREIIAAYKLGIDDHELQQPTISLKRKKVK